MGACPLRSAGQARGHDNWSQGRREIRIPCQGSQRCRRFATIEGQRTSEMQAKGAPKPKLICFCHNIASYQSMFCSTNPVSSNNTKLIFQVDPPGSPDAPKIGKVTKKSVEVLWTRPASDGGSPITGYVLYKKKAGTDKWEPCNDVPQKVGDLLESRRIRLIFIWL